MSGTNPQGLGRRRHPQLLDCHDPSLAEQARLLAGYRSQRLSHAQAEFFASVSFLFMRLRAAGFQEGQDFRLETAKGRVLVSRLAGQWIQARTPSEEWENCLSLRAVGFITEAD